MRKFFIIAALSIISISAFAQPRAIGLRGGYNLEVSYQHSIGKDFAEITVGTPGFHGIGATATYNFMLCQPQWTTKGEWGVYAGPGVAGGAYLVDNGYAYVGVAGQLGLEYSFWFPLQLSLDLRPVIGLGIGGGNVHFFDDWVNIFSPALSIRYRF